MRISVCIISANRTYRVEETQKQYKGLNISWYVPKDQVKDYVTAGATSVIGVKGIMPMRGIQNNRALYKSFVMFKSNVCVIIDDDLNGFVDIQRRQISCKEAITEMSEELMDSPYYLAGTNTRYRRMSFGETEKFGRLDFIHIHKRNTEIIYDTNIKGALDIDLCVAHHEQYGGLLKIRDFAALHHNIRFSSGNMPGGWVDLRTGQMTIDAVNYLNKKWSNYLNGEKFDYSINAKNEPSLFNKINWKKLHETHCNTQSS